MIHIKRLKRPNKRSGFPLTYHQKTTVRGVAIINLNPFTIYIDPFTPKKKKKKRKG